MSTTIYDTNKQYWQQKTFISQSFQEMLSYIIPGSWILDIGCGGGRLALALAELGAIYGLDSSPELITELKGKHPDLNWIHGNAEDLKLWKKLPQFDDIVSNVCIRKDQCRLDKLMSNIVATQRNSGLLFRIQGANDLPGYVQSTPCYSEEEIRKAMIGWDCEISTERYQQRFTNLDYLRTSIHRIGMIPSHKVPKQKINLHVNREYILVRASKK